ncbi:MAG: hypothetical protein ACQERF_06845 [Actinomycetota bacterium]
MTTKQRAEQIVTGLPLADRSRPRRSAGSSPRGSGACPKHFAANGQETGRMVIDTIVEELILRELYLRGRPAASPRVGAGESFPALDRVIAALKP